MMKETVVIVAAAMAASNGLDASSFCASVRAGISMKSTLKIQGLDYPPLVMGAVPDECFAPLKDEIADDTLLTVREKRLIRLAGLLEPELEKTRITNPSPVFMGLPRKIPHPEKVLESIVRQLDLPVLMQKSGYIPRGRASGLLAVYEACRLLQDQGAAMVIAGGCDTYLDLELLGFLNHESRLKTATNFDCFVPGEGVCLLTLMMEKNAERNGFTPLARISSAAFGIEPGHLYNDIPFKGEGLSNAFTKLFQNREIPLPRIKTVFSSMNGESFWSEEWGNALIPHLNHFEEDFQLNHPAEVLGDTGAACGTLMAGCAMTGLKEGYIKGPVLVYAASDSQERAAILMEQIKEV